jgi:hypothetical protein
MLMQQTTVQSTRRRSSKGNDVLSRFLLLCERAGRQAGDQTGYQTDRQANRRLDVGNANRFHSSSGSNGTTARALRKQQKQDLCKAVNSKVSEGD